MSDYSSVVRDFAALGSRIYQTDPTKHYGSIGTIGKRPLEPGFIPPDCRPRFVSISYYPNESEIQVFERWLTEALRAKDVGRILEAYAPDRGNFIFDADSPHQSNGPGA